MSVKTRTRYRGIAASAGVAVGLAQHAATAARRRSGDADPEPIVLITDELTPPQAAQLDPARVCAVLAARGSVTAHGVIIARAKGLPTVVGLGDEVLAIPAGTRVLVDGSSGVVQLQPSSEALQAAHERQAHDQREAAELLSVAGRPAITRDGVRLDIFANVGSVQETREAIAFGAEGIGMLRTEFVFQARDHVPGADEQTTSLMQIAEILAGRPLVVRTLDAGADKPMPALHMPREDNPFLGVRGIRLSLLREELLTAQFEAILRVAAAGHPVKVMLPMVATLAEITAARALLEEVRGETGITVPIEVGITVEVPAAAITAAQLAPHVDFFSLGTNDLTQYTMAAERGEARLAGLISGPQPAVLRLAQLTAEAAAADGRCWVGVCGELCGDPASAILLAGLGARELSMSPILIPQVKAALRRVTLADARAAALAALQAPDASAARELALAVLG